MFGRFIALLVLAAGCGLRSAVAQEDLNRGKTAAQLFASDCADCHRNPRALTRNDPATLSRFLRVHYTANRESASALAAYLISLGPDPRRSGGGQRRRAAQPQGQTAQPAAKPGETPGPKPPEAASEKPGEAPAAKAGEVSTPAAPQAAPADPQ